MDLQTERGVLMYVRLVYLHIISAIASIGPLFVLLLLIKRMQEAEEVIVPGYVHSFQTCIDIVRYAGHAVVITGAILVIVGDWTWGSSWIVLTLIILAASLVFLARAFKPTMKTFGTEAFQKQRFVQTLTRNTWIYIFLLLFILALMVMKPFLW